MLWILGEIRGNKGMNNREAVTATYYTRDPEQQGLFERRRSQNKTQREREVPCVGGGGRNERLDQGKQREEQTQRAHEQGQGGGKRDRGYFPGRRGCSVLPFLLAIGERTLGPNRALGPRNQHGTCTQAKPYKPWKSELMSGESGSSCRRAQGRHICVSIIGRMRWTIVQTFSKKFQCLLRNSWAGGRQEGGGGETNKGMVNFFSFFYTSIPA